MMQCLPVNLDAQCEICNGSEYSEHESGFYVCCTCGTMTQIRFGMDLDYADTGKGLLILKKKVNDTQVEIELGDKSTDVGGCDALMNTCANSEFGDSITTYRSISKKTNQPVKSMKDIFYDYQKMFVNLFRSVAYNQFHNKEAEEFELTDYYQNLSILAREKWKNFIAKEYQIQMKLSRQKPSKQVRSRRNTEDEGNYALHYHSVVHHPIHHQTHQYANRHKKHSIRDQLKHRKVKNYNIETIEEYREKKLKKQDKIHLFIEEFDQVKSHILSQTDILEKEKITPNEALTFKSILIISKHLGVKLRENSNYEEVIHQIFTHCGLNLISVFKESVFDENKSHFTPDHFLTLLYFIFNNSFYNTTNQHEANDSEILLLGELLNLYRSFKLYNLNNSEIKFLKYLNKEKLLKFIHEERKHELNFRKHRYAQKIKKYLQFICEDTLKLPQFLTNFCLFVYNWSEKVIQKKITHIYNLENFALGIVYFAIKVLYGLNDLPYMVMLFLNNDNEQFNKLYSQIGSYYMSHSERDPLFKLYKQVPSLTKLVELIKNKILKRDKENNVWDTNELKKDYNTDYKNKLIDYNERFFSHLENSFTTSNISALERKIEILQSESKQTNQKKISVRFKEKFLNKKKEMMSPKDSTNLHNFLDEEIDFYKKLEIKNSKKKTTSKTCEIPLPCDTYLRYDKKAMKFEGIAPPLSELVLLFYLSKLFRVDFKTLKKCFKVIEKAMEENKELNC